MTEVQPSYLTARYAALCRQERTSFLVTSENLERLAIADELGRRGILSGDAPVLC